MLSVLLQVALDAACNSLRLGKCDHALAAGVEVMHSPQALKLRHPLAP